MGAAAAGPDAFHTLGVAYFQRDAVVVGQLLAGLDRTQGFNHHAVPRRICIGAFNRHRLTVGITAVIDPACGVALEVGVDDVVVVEREQESVEETESMTKRIKADLWYMENWSFLLDLKIVFLTLVQILKKNENTF